MISTMSVGSVLPSFQVPVSYAPDRSEEKIKKREGGGVGGVLHSFYSAFGFYKFLCSRPPHFLSASYAPDVYTIIYDGFHNNGKKNPANG